MNQSKTPLWEKKLPATPQFCDIKGYLNTI